MAPFSCPHAQRRATERHERPGACAAMEESEEGLLRDQSMLSIGRSEDRREFEGKNRECCIEKLYHTMPNSKSFWNAAV